MIKRVFVSALFVSMAFFSLNAQDELTNLLENDYLEVELGPNPFIASYLHKATGKTISSGSQDGYLRINEKDAPWDTWNIVRTSEGDAVQYNMAHQPTGIKFDVVVSLNGSQAEYQIRNIAEDKILLNSIQ